jgi:PD-(D/E)XK nuclease family transposase
MPSKPRTLVSFDYAIKYLLRQKENFVVLEGFLTDLFERKIKVTKVLDSESNQVDRDDKFSRFDVLVSDEWGDVYIIELQYDAQVDYIPRIIYGASKVITEHLRRGEDYIKIKKVISISILYFDVIDTGNKGDKDSKGSKDSIFRLNNQIVGMFDGKPAALKAPTYIVDKTKNKTKDKSNNDAESYNPFPDYIFINLNKFNDEIHRPIDEWMFMFRHSEFAKKNKKINPTNLKDTEKALNYVAMNSAQKKVFDAFEEGAMNARSIRATANSSLDKSFIEGKAEGEQKKAIAIAQKLKAKGFDIDDIIEATGLSLNQIKQL